MTYKLLYTHKYVCLSNKTCNVQASKAYRGSISLIDISFTEFVIDFVVEESNRSSFGLFESVAILLTKNAGCFGVGRVTVLLSSIRTIDAIVGLSLGSS
jgi:predicted transport protein